jgi:glycosyltransferase involved in cell wall biosynthesis
VYFKANITAPDMLKHKTPPSRAQSKLPTKAQVCKSQCEDNKHLMNVFYFGSRGGGINDFKNIVEYSGWRAFSVYDYGVGESVYKEDQTRFRSLTGWIRLVPLFAKTLDEVSTNVIVMVSPFNILLPIIRIITFKRGNVAYVVHNTFAFQNTRSVMRNAATLFLEFIGRLSADRLLFLSANTYENSSRYWQKKGAVVGFGCTVLRSGQKSLNKPLGRPSFLLFGRALPYKGIDILSQAIPLITQKCHIRVCGENVLQFMQKTAANSKVSLEIEDKWVAEADLATYLDQADVILLPYRQVSQSGPLLIAIGHKKPILVSDCPGFKEFVSFYRAHLCFSSGSPASLAHAIDRVCADHKRLDKMRAYAAADRANFGWQSVRENIVSACLRSVKTA